MSYSSLPSLSSRGSSTSSNRNSPTTVPLMLRSPSRGTLPRSSLPNASRSYSIVTMQQLCFLGLAMIAVACNVLLIRQMDKVAPTGADSNKEKLMNDYIHTDTDSQPSSSLRLHAQVVEPLQQAIRELHEEQQQMKLSIQQHAEQQLLLEQVARGSQSKSQRALLLEPKGQSPQHAAAVVAEEQPLSAEQQHAHTKRRRSIMADAKVSSFTSQTSSSHNDATPLPDAIPLDYTTLPDPVGNSKKSSVDYHACCGLGHRLSRLSDANYVAQRLRMGLRSFWGFCGGLEVFYYLFGPQRPESLVNVTDTGNILRISNNVKGINMLARWPLDNDKHSCDNTRCGFDKADMDVRFYTDLRERFRFSPHVNKFRELHFKNKTVIGVHIRAGNGEGGDFVWKGRGIANETAWVSNLVAHIREVAASTENPVLFVASDTERMIDLLREKLQGIMRVLHVQQQRPEEGQGVMFGEKKAVLNEGAECLQGWEMSLVDMILLSHADAVIVGRPSSFTQTMPMSMMYARPEAERRIAKPYCEVNPEATLMHCYSDYKDWCCKGKTSFYITSRKKQEYIHVPHVPFDLDEHKGGIYERSTDRHKCLGRRPGIKVDCIPYHWGPYRLLANRTIMTLPEEALVRQAL